MVLSYVHEVVLPALDSVLNSHTLLSNEMIHLKLFSRRKFQKMFSKLYILLEEGLSL